MRFSKLLLCVLPLLAVTACADDDGITDLGPPPPAASVRFINANVDTGAVDLRFPDRVENLPTLMGVAFRGTSGFYQRVGDGNRLTRVFPSGSSLALTTTRLVDTQTNLTANQRYTMVYAGRTRAGAPAAEAARLVVLEDPSENALPNPDTLSIAFQALHTAVGVGNVDVYIVPVATTAAATPADFATNNAGVLRNVAYLQRTASYVTVPRRPAGTFYRFVVTAAGSPTALFAVTPNQPGVAAPLPGAVGHGTVGPQPGVQVGRSVMTAVVFPGSTPGTRQSAAANQTPTLILIPDRVLNP
jgi:hypothetical protein